MKVAVRLLASFAMVCCVAAAARAQGVLISSKVTIGTGAPTTQEMQIDRNRMRAEMADPSSGKTIMIFDGARQVMQIVSVDKKTYLEMTKATVEQMAGQLSGMMAQMEAAMANMPPAQRAQIEAMMRGRGGAGMPGGMAGMMAPARPEYRKTGTDRVGTWACEKYEGTANGQKVSDVCTVDPGALGLAPADMTVLTQIADFIKSLTSMIPGAATGMVGITGQGFPGIPIRTITTVGGTTTTTEITNVSRQTFPDSLFQVPAGFTKQAMPTMGGRGPEVR